LYTAAQIIQRAVSIAKVTSGMTPIAGQYLNTVLEELCQTYDLSLNTKTVVVSLTGSTPNNGIGPYLLPTDYLRAQQKDLTYLVQGEPFVLVQITLAQLDVMVNTTGLSSYPNVYATDISPLTKQLPPYLYVYPPPATIIPLQIRYYALQPDIPTPETSNAIPWFPFQQYLIRRVAGELMADTGDQRADAFLGDSPSGALGMLRRYLNLQGDDEDMAKTVELDSRWFGRGFLSFPPSKASGAV
jgi:hypothetical protein